MRAGLHPSIPGRRLEFAVYSNQRRAYTCVEENKTGNGCCGTDERSYRNDSQDDTRGAGARCDVGGNEGESAKLGDA